MPTFNHQGRQVYYEVRGTGRPILILNGIMMSTKSWEPFVSTLSEHNQLIRLDFLDQGQSDRMENASYTQDLQVDVIYGLLEILKLPKVSIVGISYGGEVATLFAGKHPSMVDRLVLFNSTPYTSPWLMELGRQWNAIGKTRDGQTYYRTTIPVIYSPTFYESRLEWMNKREAFLIPIFSNPVFLDAMERLTLSAESYDARPYLDKITAPTLIVAADEDALTPIKHQRELHQMIPHAELIIIPGAGHASMYEKPLIFTTLVLGFVNAKETTYTI